MAEDSTAALGASCPGVPPTPCADILCRFYNDYPCVIISGKGQPDVATRLFLNKVRTPCAAAHAIRFASPCSAIQHVCV